MEKLQILIGDALEAKDILDISFLWKDLIKCMREFFFFFFLQHLFGSLFAEFCNY